MRSIVAVVAALLVAAHAGVPYKFADKYSVIQLQQLLVNRGGGMWSDEAQSLYCPLHSAGCGIQTGFMAARAYQDATQNITALKNPDGSGIVSFYNVSREFQVTSNGTCVAYCPLQDPYFYQLQIPPRSKDEGQVEYLGKSVEYWYDWELISVDSWWVDQSGSVPVPVTHVQSLLFEVNVTNNFTFLDYQPNAATDDNFRVLGWETCPEAKGCVQPPPTSEARAVSLERMNLSPLRAATFFPDVDMEELLG
jgi:hypothetical protein